MNKKFIVMSLVLGTIGLMDFSGNVLADPKVEKEKIIAAAEKNGEYASSQLTGISKKIGRLPVLAGKRFEQLKAEQDYWKRMLGFYQAKVSYWRGESSPTQKDWLKKAAAIRSKYSVSTEELKERAGLIATTPDGKPTSIECPEGIIIDYDTAPRILTIAGPTCGTPGATGTAASTETDICVIKVSCVVRGKRISSLRYFPAGENGACPRVPEKWKTTAEGSFEASATAPDPMENTEAKPTEEAAPGEGPTTPAPAPPTPPKPPGTP